MSQNSLARRDKLAGFLATNPGDAFARYGLALECAQLGDSEAAIEHFRRLLEEHPAYVAGYYQYAQLLAKLGRVEEAKRIFSSGIVAAQKAGDAHARDEMQAALSEFS